MKIKGTPVSPGIAVGQVLVYQPFTPELTGEKIRPEEVPNHINCYLTQRARARNELSEILKHVQQTDLEQAAIFSAHIEILCDEIMSEEITNIISQQLIPAQMAVHGVYAGYAAIVAKTEDALIRERAADIEDVRNRLLRLLSGTKVPSLALIDKPVILVAKELFPSDTALLNHKNILGIITERGGATCHTAILAKSYGIPAILGVPQATAFLQDDATIILDALTGEITMHPNPDELQSISLQQATFAEKQEEIQQYITSQPVTRDGVSVGLYLNISSLKNLQTNLLSNVDGIGLFRTEFLYMSANGLPNEEVQLATYSKLLKTFEGHPVTIRTLDIGGDKPVKGLNIPEESNPFLGLRALRLCFDQIPLFKTQLRACLRASVDGNLRIMFPMVSSIDDIRLAKQIVEEVQQELTQEGHPFAPDIPLGIMIEVPSIALIADLAAKEVDFASIGTNDLCQYLMAADRLSPQMEKYYQSCHPAVFRIIDSIAKAFDSQGKELSICGEMAGNPATAAAFIGLGIRNLSMNPSSVAAVKHMLSHLSSTQATIAAKELLNLDTSKEAEQFLKDAFSY